MALLASRIGSSRTPANHKLSKKSINLITRLRRANEKIIMILNLAKDCYVSDNEIIWGSFWRDIFSLEIKSTEIAVNKFSSFRKVGNDLESGKQTLVSKAVERIGFFILDLRIVGNMIHVMGPYNMVYTV